MRGRLAHAHDGQKKLRPVGGNRHGQSSRRIRGIFWRRKSNESRRKKSALHVFSRSQLHRSRLGVGALVRGDFFDFARLRADEKQATHRFCQGIILYFLRLRENGRYAFFRQTEREKILELRTSQRQRGDGSQTKSVIFAYFERKRQRFRKKIPE